MRISRRVALAALALVAGLAGFANDALAQSRPGKLPLIRDAEIEALLKDYTTPLFAAAGFGKGAVDVYIVDNESFNAFVTERRMFINTGTLKKAKTPNEVIGVLAHETGHILGGHALRFRDRVNQANVIGALAMLAGMGAAATGGEGGAAAGRALALGTQSAVMRDLLSYRRSEEATADNAGVTLLDKTGQSAKGMLTTFENMNRDILFTSSRIDPVYPEPSDASRTHRAARGHGQAQPELRQEGPPCPATAP